MSAADPRASRAPGWRRSLPLPAAVRLVWHETRPHPRDVPVAELYTDLEFPPPDDTLPYLAVNMIMTLNGEATVAGKAVTIGTPVDSLVLTRLRAASDAVLTGVGTLLAEDVTAALPEAEAARRAAAGRPPHLLAAILATTLSFDPEILSRRFFTDRRFDRLVLTGDRAAEADVRRVQDFGVEVARVSSDSDGRPHVRAALEALGARGARLVVSEGGPHVFASLLRARVVREYFLTTTPFATGNPRALRPIAGDVAGAGRPLLLARVSRYEHTFQDPATGAHLIEAYERFRVVYPE
jgi:riboflavin biosynthesis pyrimidine reductase